ncbi:WG repeat-containing protein [Paenibacillus durus]|uniref:Copper amine oxidase-like N-terminal domain-containing protein n=1 Tax=Paenibacillus durus TaxID=44251 RepID=A0A089IYK5_PAEDU|nr:WG repeat-containing protein [Paenibacillus durus]AIQ14024.1 hypothetical protein PDUR_20460 [Paenibacillus durus]
MCAYRNLFTGKKNMITTVAIGLLTLSALLGFGNREAYANNWELFDQGEHLLLPEGPIVQDGAIMVPIRPIAERFGYGFTSVTASEVNLKNGKGSSLSVKPGDDKAVFNGNVKTLEQKPSYINGNLFIPLSLAGELSGSGYSIVSDTNLIQLRPVEGDAGEKLNSQYWYSFSTTEGTVAVNSLGQEMLSTSYTENPDFGYEELIPVKKNGISAGYMNRAGELAFAASHYQLGQFNEGLATFKDLVTMKGGGTQVRIGYLNRTGRIVIPAAYDHAYNFSDGLAKVVKGGKTYYIDHNGKTAIPVISGIQSSDSFSEGKAAVSVLVKTGGKTTAKTGFIDTKGQWVLKPVFDWAGPFSDGIAVASMNGKSGLIDKNGKWIVKPQYSKDAGFSGSFENGYILFVRRSGNSYKQWLMDTKGKLTAVPGADHIGTYSEGLVPYEANNLYGYKNLAGDVIIKPQFAWVEGFRGGAARAHIFNQDDTYTSLLIDKTGKILWPGANH